MELNTLEKHKILTEKKRLGRGRGSGKGCHTVGRGTKGQKAREGAKPRLGFEGGQTPLYKRLPKIGGFRNPTLKEMVVFNLDRFDSFKEGDVITPEVLLEKKMISFIPSGGIKLLSNGDLKKKLTFKGFKVSKRAMEKIEKSGSKIDA